MICIFFQMGVNIMLNHRWLTLPFKCKTSWRCTVASNAISVFVAGSLRVPARAAMSGK